MNTVAVLLADDHRIVLEGIKAVLKDHPQLSVVGAVENGEEVLAFVKQHPVQVVVLDINMPVMDGLTCARRLKNLYPAIKIIILTMYAQKSFIEEIIRLGIDGCLLKSNTGTELGEAILRVHTGKSYYDMVQTFTVEPEEAPHKLSEREIEIIKLLALGLTSFQIAEKLFIAAHTVKTHRKNILRKIDAHTTNELVQFALNHKII
jgi:DNA-binding NarL/FixJ family response regulator